MTVDLYKPCPCGSGKKIKFCCREIANDLERIQRMIEGEQRLAAIEKIDALLKRHPKHSALLMLKAEVFMQMREFGKFASIVEELKQIDPANPSAHALDTMSKIVATAPVAEVLASMQYALECVKEVMTRTVYDSIYLVVNYLISHGLPFSAKGYLQFAIMVSDGKDSRCISMLNQLNRSDEVPFLLREHIDSGARPPDVTWAREFDVAMHVASRGMWGRAVQMLRDMSYRILDEPAILRNLAIVLALNGQTVDAARVFRQFSELSRLPMLDRVHAMALASLFDPDGAKSLVDVVDVEIPIKEIEKAIEAFRTHAKSQAVEIREMPNDQQQPKAAYDLISRELPKESDEIKAEDLPLILGRIYIYGKRTDRDARIEFIRARDAGYDDGLELLRSILGDNLGEAQDPTVLTKTSRVASESIGAPKFPDFVKPEEQMKLHRQHWAHAIHHKWTHQPQPCYGGKSPKEAAQDAAHKVRLLADLLMFEVEHELDNSEYGIDIDALHDELGISKREQIDVSQRPIRHIPVSHLGRVDIESLSDDELLEAYRYSFAVFAGGILRRICLEIAKRDSIVDKIDKVEVYDVLSDLATESNESLEWLEKARKLATSQGESPALWLIDEMQIRLLRGELERFQQLMTEVQNRYMNEPGVAQAMMSMLQRFGIVGPDGQPRNAGAESETEQPVSVGTDGVWTPESSPAQGSTEKGESKLWIPD